MQNIAFLDEMNSFTFDGTAFVQLEFEQNITADEFENVLQEVRAKFNNIDLPDDIGEEVIDDFSSTDFFPVIQVIIYGDVPYAELVDHSDRLGRRIRRIDGVNEVSEIGVRELEVLVEVDRERSDSYGISLQQVSQSIRDTNLSLPGGTLSGTSGSFLLRTDESAGVPEEISRSIIRTSGGSLAYVGDLATVAEVYDRDGIIFRYNGQPAIAVSVTKIPKSDSVRIVNQTRQIVAAYQQSSTVAGSNAQFDFFGDSSVEVTRNIRTLGLNIIIGFVLVVLVLYAFLGIRNSILTALGIPISFAATLLILGALDITLNSNVLFALVLVLGLIVDHAIIIVENAYRYNLDGMSRSQAAIKGVNQVISPVVSATATTIAAFLPLTFLPGIIGRFLSVVPIAACAALTVSTLEALFILPSHYADWGKKNAPVRSEKRFNAFRDGFKRLLMVVYRHRIITVATFVALIIVSVALFGLVGQDLFASDEFSLFYIDVQMPSGSALEQTGGVIDQFEERLLPLLSSDDVVSISSSIGFLSGEDSETAGADVGQLTVDVLDLEDGRERDLDTLIAEARELTKDIVGAEDVRYRKLESGPPTDAPVVYRLYGDNYDDLEAVSVAIQERLTAHPQLVDIRDNFGEGNPELRFIVDKSAASRYGLSVRQIGQFINNAIEGIPSGTTFSDNRELDIVVGYREDTITRPEQLLLLKIPNASGQLIPLSSVAHIETGRSVNIIRRLDQQREITVQSDATNTEDLFVIDNDIRQYFAAELEPRYPDVELVTGGQFAEFANLVSDILIVLGIGLFLIYAILGAQFRSYLQPVLIIMTIPFAFLGVILYLIISGTTLSTIVIYAAVALAGIAVNDSIVLISFINKLRATGKSVYESVITAATMRLRPIILTSLTTIVGLVPTSLGLGGESLVWIPMANTIIFGLLFSTLTTLIIVPCLYGLALDRKKNRVVTAA